MRFGYHTNGLSCEYKMQDELKKWLEKKELKFIDELSVIEVSRVPDFLVWIPENGLVNIEAKSNNFELMMLQLDDNAIYCNYSFAFIPDYSITPRWFKAKLAETGYGLIIYNLNEKILTEVLEAHQNKGIDKNLQKIVIGKMNKQLIIRKQKNYIDTQKEIENF